ncbi:MULTISPECIES: ABC transporter ATP-binding protein [Protofrankia]|uniref:ABC transporter ATP-binding protein n=1 Tax=Protofrankia TaxID=2994361 RepID=UPI0006405CC9|nr:MULTISPECIES: ABC transporter ATP-binding protein [Protofrankia]ONH36691.1 hypothetical protein BL254_05345 [Protofrankia sp. BMG5.30]
MRIAIEDLSVVLAGRAVVAGVHLVAGEGEIAGLVGPNGSGRSTVLRTVYRHLRPRAGRVLLARALAQQPDVLVLDEPTNHLDVRHQVELLALLRAQRRTTLLALHDLNAAAAVCDRLHVLQHGTIVASGAPQQVLTPALLAAVFGVRAAVVEHPLTGDALIAYDHHTPAATPNQRQQLPEAVGET